MSTTSKNINLNHTSDDDLFKYYQEKHGDRIPIDDIKAVYRMLKLFVKDKINKEEPFAIPRFIGSRKTITISDIKDPEREKQGIESLEKFIYKGEMDAETGYSIRYIMAEEVQHKFKKDIKNPNRLRIKDGKIVDNIKKPLQ